MIEFSCTTCNHVLRAPAILAGKKGRCACCGAVNPVPEPVSVEVARTPGHSPFRSTADLEVRGTIEGTVELEEARFLATAPHGASIHQKSDEFFEEVSTRINQVIEEIDGHGLVGSVQPMPVARLVIEEAAMEGRSSPADARILPTPTLDEPPAEVRRRTMVALVVGLLAGFCLGLMAARLL
jgi:hypothetical protein